MPRTPSHVPSGAGEVLTASLPASYQSGKGAPVLAAICIWCAHTHIMSTLSVSLPRQCLPNESSNLTQRCVLACQHHPPLPTEVNRMPATPSMAHRQCTSSACTILHEHGRTVCALGGMGSVENTGLRHTPHSGHKLV